VTRQRETKSHRFAYSFARGKTDFLEPCLEFVSFDRTVLLSTHAFLQKLIFCWLA
jgi:hypothetical protein